MFRSLIAFGVLAAVFPGSAAAVPVPKEPAKDMPHLVLQVKSFDGLVADYHALHARLKGVSNWLVPPDELHKILEMAFPGWKKGLDKTKQWGGYLNFQSTIEDSRFVLMIPCDDPIAYMNNRGLLGGKIEEDQQTGIFSSTILGIRTFFRFQFGYIYVTFNDSKGIDNTKSLAKGAEIFLKDETAIVAVRLYVEGVPESVKKTARAFLEKLSDNGRSGLVEMLLMGMVGASDIEDLSKRLIRLVDEAQWAAMRIDLAEKLTFEFELIPRRGSAFAREIVEFKPRPSRLTGLLDEDTAVGLANSFGSFGGFKIDPKDMDSAVSELLKETGLDGDAATVAPLAKALFDSIRVDESDLAIALKMSPRKETYALVLAAKLNKAKVLESAIVTYLKLLPEAKRKQFTPNALKLENGATVHKLSLPMLPAKGKTLFGQSDLYFLFDQDTLFAALGADAVDRLKEAVKLTKKDGTRFLIQTNPTLLTGFVQENLGDAHADSWAKRFPKSERINLLTGSVERGGSLRVKYTLDIVPFLKIAETFSRF